MKELKAVRRSQARGWWPQKEGLIAMAISSGAPGLQDSGCPRDSATIDGFRAGKYSALFSLGLGGLVILSILVDGDAGGARANLGWPRGTSAS